MQDNADMGELAEDEWPDVPALVYIEATKRPDELLKDGLAGPVTKHEPRSSAPSAMRPSALHPRSGSADEGQDLRQRGRGSVSWRRHREGAMSGPDLDSAGEVVVRHQPVDQA